MLGVAKTHRATTTNKPGAKHPGGRPSDYKAFYCKAVVEFLSKGYSLAAFAGSIGVSRETVYEWGRSIPEFSDALAKAKAARTLYWERRLDVATKDARAVIFALRNACAEEWKNDPDVSVTVNNDVGVKVDLSKPPEDWCQAELEEALKQRGALESVAGKKQKPATNGGRH